MWQATVRLQNREELILFSLSGSRGVTVGVPLGRRP